MRKVVALLPDAYAIGIAASVPQPNVYSDDLQVHAKFSFDALKFGAKATSHEANQLAHEKPSQYPDGFDPNSRTIDSKRYLQDPNCGWSTWDAVRAGTGHRPGLNQSSHETASSLLIWIDNLQAESAYTT